MYEVDPEIAPPGPQLRKNYLSFAENLAQAVGSVAPSGGIALTIGLSFGLAGNATWLLYVLVMGAFVLIGININEFASRTSSPGGVYHFSELALGSVAGVIAGWTYVFGLFFSICSPALTFAHYAIVLCRLIPGFAGVPAAAFVFLLIAVVATCWISCRDVRLSTHLILMMECVSVGLMLVLAAVFLWGPSRWLDLPQLKLTGATWNGFRAGSVFAFFSMVGFESAITLGGESKKALQNIPRATLMCLLPAGIPFILMAYVLVASFRGFPQTLDQAEAPFDHLAAVCGLPSFGHLINAGILLSFFACTLGTMNAAARVLYAMAKKGHFWTRAGTAHERNATPHRALIVVGVLVFALPAVLMLSGMSLDHGIDYTAQLGSFGFFVTYLMICIAAPIYLRRLGVLRARHIVFAVAGVLALLIPLLSFLYPLPEGPAVYFPYIFIGLVVAASLWSLRARFGGKA